MFWHPIGKIIWALILFPIIWVLEHIAAIILTIAAPATHIASYAIHTLVAPFILLRKLETLYIYLGTAVLLGLFTGAALYLTSRVTYAFLGISSRKTSWSDRTVASYRSGRAKQKIVGVHGQTHPDPGRKNSSNVDTMLRLEDSDWAAIQNLGPPTPMMGTMILEEDSSSE